MMSSIEMTKEPVKIYGGSDLAAKVALFNKKANEHEEKQLTNPFSNWEGATHRVKLNRDDVNYGKPVEGSKTEFRGKKANVLISNEIVTLCNLIFEFGERTQDGTAWITFGELFQIYTRISNKLVGLLMRARKHGLLDFEGEMLFQRRDDNVVISLLKPIRQILRQSREEVSPSKTTENSET